MGEHSVAAVERRYDAASLILFAAGLVGGSILDFWLDLPVSLFAAVFALTMLAWFAINVPRQARRA